MMPSDFNHTTVHKTFQDRIEFSYDHLHSHSNDFINYFSTLVQNGNQNEALQIILKVKSCIERLKNLLPSSEAQGNVVEFKRETIQKEIDLDRNLLKNLEEIEKKYLSSCAS